MTKAARRRVSWVKAARKAFEGFPQGAQLRALDALTLLAEGATPSIAKPLQGLGAGVWELAIRERGDAFRVIYALQIDDDLWVIDAFQKKSTSGIATADHIIERVRTRLRTLREILR
jgi:phage-related protein